MLTIVFILKILKNKNYLLYNTLLIKLSVPIEKKKLKDLKRKMINDMHFNNNFKKVKGKYNLLVKMILLKDILLMKNQK